jgi:methionyl-tRNA synthetase
MVHTLGKDISRFHAVYRPAMLMAAGLEQYIPKQEYVGGFFTVDGQKMSKSLGNTIYAEDLVLSMIEMRWYFISSMISLRELMETSLERDLRMSTKVCSWADGEIW